MQAIKRSPPKSRASVFFIFFLFCIFRGVLPGYFTVDDNIRNTVSAKTVGTVNASGYFPGGEKAGNRSSVGSQDMHLGIDPYAAHGMMNGRFDTYRIERRRLESGCHLRTATPEVFINA